MILGFILFSLIAILGIPTYSHMIGNVEKDSPAQMAGILAGDKIIRVNDVKTNNWAELIENISNVQGKVELTILRNNETIKKEIEVVKNDRIGILPYISTEIKEVLKKCPAQKAGLKKGDVVVSIDDKQVFQWDEMTEIIRKNPGKELIFSINRKGNLMDIRIIPVVKSGYDANKKKEIKIGSIGIFSCNETYHVNPLVALWHGLLQTLSTIQVIFVTLGQLMTGILSFKLLSGPIGIIQISGEQAQLGISSLLGFMAMLSVNLGIINLLPLPVLDGGQLTLLIIEKIRGKALNTKIQAAIQLVGIIMIICLTIFLSQNDIMRLISV